jgi:hypothetical protein
MLLAAITETCRNIESLYEKFRSVLCILYVIYVICTVHCETFIAIIINMKDWTL